MRLSKNFVLSEITRSNTAKRLGISNEPTKEHLVVVIVPKNLIVQSVVVLNRNIVKVKLWICNFGKMVKCVIKRFMTGL